MFLLMIFWEDSLPDSPFFLDLRLFCVETPSIDIDWPYQGNTARADLAGRVVDFW